MTPVSSGHVGGLGTGGREESEWASLPQSLHETGHGLARPLTCHRAALRVTGAVCAEPFQHLLALPSAPPMRPAYVWSTGSGRVLPGCPRVLPGGRVLPGVPQGCLPPDLTQVLVCLAGELVHGALSRAKFLVSGLPQNQPSLPAPDCHTRPRTG